MLSVKDGIKYNYFSCFSYFGFCDISEIQKRGNRTCYQPTLSSTKLVIERGEWGEMERLRKVSAYFRPKTKSSLKTFVPRKPNLDPRAMYLPLLANQYLVSEKALGSRLT